MQDNLLQQIQNAEQKFKANNYKGTFCGPCMVESYGSYPVLLSAPHAVTQIRQGHIKAHEFYTGAIAQCLAQYIGCACITRKYLTENTPNDDPNTDSPLCPYKTAVTRFLQQNNIKLFVDIHGLSAKRDSIVDICIDHGKNINNMDYISDLIFGIENQFGKNSCSVDKYFAASSENVMSKWVHTAFQIPSVQLEINGAYRWFENNQAQQSLDLFFCLATWLKNIPFS